jgi:hypothetical protein
MLIKLLKQLGVLKMITNSHEDIAWFRSIEKQKQKYGKSYKKRISGTEKNIRRRQQIK